MTSAGTILASKDGHVARIVLDNPTKLNAISPEMALQLPDLLSQFDEDPDVRLLVVSGDGEKAFSSGAQLGAPPSVAGAEHGMQVFSALQEFRKPTVAAIRGYCLGGGVALACACDLRICNEEAMFSIPSARLGLAYRVDFTQWLINLVGSANAKEMLLTGRRYTAAEAFRFGLVNQVVSTSDFQDEVDKLCQTIAKNAPLATSASKQIVDQLVRQEGADAELCAALIEGCEDSADLAEGKRAMAEKRKPDFTGR